MTIESEIIAVIESRNGRADRLAIMSTLHAYSQGSIEVKLSGMSKKGDIVRVSKGVYELPKADASGRAPIVEVKARWLADDLAPYQRVRLYIEAVGRPKKQAVLTMLAPYVDGAVRAFGAMVVEGLVHQADDGRIVLGRSPKMPVVRQHRDPVRRPLSEIDTPVEASEKASAEAASEVLETIATSTPAADVPDVVDDRKTPAPGIDQEPADMNDPTPASDESPAAEIRPPLALLELARELIGVEEYEAIERLRIERGQAPCEFSVCVPGFHAVISGEPRACFQAIKRIIAAAEGAA